MNNNKLITEKLTGFLLINKPENISSYDCIRYLKKILKQKIKIGHTGTLDNFATGLLIICIGKNATKKSATLLNLNKEYIIKAKLGELTDTLDKTGKIIDSTKNLQITQITQEDLKNAIKKLGDNYTQIPPIYSALKYNGSPLYQLARENFLDAQALEKIVEQKSRRIKILNIETLNYNNPFFTIKAEVSKGTYARSLANDIAKNLNSFATTYELNRTKIGNITTEKSINLHDIKSLEELEKNIISIENLKF